ncbi:MAG: hypothetical protein QOC90_1021, partial [Mycobacterium sp.]|nr:hypothetical protein [Mycobacterium sp.]
CPPFPWSADAVPRPTPNPRALKPIAPTIADRAIVFLKLIPVFPSVLWACLRIASTDPSRDPRPAPPATACASLDRGLLRRAMLRGCVTLLTAARLLYRCTGRATCDPHLLYRATHPGCYPTRSGLNHYSPDVGMLTDYWLPIGWWVSVNRLSGKGIRDGRLFRIVVRLGAGRIRGAPSCRLHGHRAANRQSFHIGDPTRAARVQGLNSRTPRRYRILERRAQRRAKRHSPVWRDQPKSVEPQ